MSCILLYLILILAGLLVGGFLNILIYRLPEDEPIFHHPSHCRSCQAVLKPKDKIPVISYLLLHGTCRNCKAKISIRYTVVELLNPLLWCIVFLWYGSFTHLIPAILTALTFSILIVVFFMDYDTQLINMVMVGIIALLGCGMTVYDILTKTTAWYDHLIGMAIGFVPLILLVILSGERAMGQGDAFLMLACGLFLGTKETVIALFLGLILGCIFGMAKKIKTGDSQFAFGPYLSLGTALSVFVAEPIANWYLTLCGF